MSASEVSDRIARALKDAQEKKIFRKMREMMKMTLEFFWKAITNSCNQVLLSGNLNTPIGTDEEFC